MPAYVTKILMALEQAGYEAYAVGGCIRDTLLGRPVNDYDVTTSALPEQILEVFASERTIPTGLKHGTVTVLTEGGSVEVTTYRIDGAYSDNRHPDAVTFTGDIRADLARRDFTVNAMAEGSRGFADPFGGREDLLRRVLRAVGDACVRFGEDALRIMRAYRFAAQLGFSIEEQTLLAAREMAGSLRTIARERIAVELLKLIVAEHAANVLHEMRENGTLAIVLQTEQALDVDACVLVPPVASLRMGALLRRMSEEAARDVLRSLKLSNKQRDAMLRAAEALKPWADGPSESTALRARRLIQRHGTDAENVARAMEALSLADGSLASAVRAEKGACISLSGLAVDGAALMAEADVHGQAVGRTLARLLEHVMRHPEDNQREILLALAKKEEE